ncbi:MAG: DUF4358 domain-containing protein [Erysipelotrichaceae bacterium]|jgi:hypothetical protein|nr:DUF4358 domain-containing protein [Erysipelotrichaceae bacterium]
MSKKFVSSVLAVLLLAGCSSSSAKTESKKEETKKIDVGDAAAQIVSDLGLENMTETPEKVLSGMFFTGDEDAFTDGAAYLSSTPTISDTVAVFNTKDVSKCEEDLNTYVDNTKNTAAAYNGEELTKFDNLVLEDNGSTVVMIISADKDAAQKAADKVLGK